MTGVKVLVCVSEVCYMLHVFSYVKTMYWYHHLGNGNHSRARTQNAIHRHV